MHVRCNREVNEFGIATQNALYNFQESKIYFTKNNLFVNII